MPTTITETLAIHMISVYNAMEEKSVEQDDLRIYSGSVSTLVRELGISMTYYKVIFRTLYDSGYCAMGDRGSRSKPTTVVLLQRPEKDELIGLTDSTFSPILSLVRELETVKTSLGGIHVVGVVAELEKRLAAVEERFKTPTIVGSVESGKTTKSKSKSK